MNSCDANLLPQIRCAGSRSIRAHVTGSRHRLTVHVMAFPNATNIRHVRRVVWTEHGESRDPNSSNTAPQCLSGRYTEKATEAWSSFQLVKATKVTKCNATKSYNKPTIFQSTQPRNKNVVGKLPQSLLSDQHAGHHSQARHSSQVP